MAVNLGCACGSVLSNFLLHYDVVHYDALQSASELVLKADIDRDGVVVYEQSITAKSTRL
jgi:hypothetical protein